MTNLRFEELGLSAEIQKAVADLGFTEATPIQSQAIPVIMEGNDVLGMAQTGTGKTAAFGIPLLEKVDVLTKKTQALVLCPTRELAVQISEEFKKFSKYIPDLQITTIFGGDSYERQFRELKRNPQIVVGTPGRVIDHLQRQTLKVEHIQTVILDEADEMLNMGFREDIELVLQGMPAERQTLLFSATMSSDILSIAKAYQNHPVQVQIARKEVTASTIEQFYFPIRSEQKVEAMCRLIEFYNLQLMLVFCNTKAQVDELVDELQGRGIGAEGLHGDMKQAQRTMVMGRFKNSRVQVLVATDVAARGIDVSGVDAVFNYDVPQDPEYYVHRIGRTGRAGKLGMSFTFVSGRDRYRLMDIERFAKIKIKRGDIPDKQSIINKRKENLVTMVKQEALESGDLKQYDDVISRLIAENLEPRQVLAALFKLYMGDLGRNLSDIDFNQDERKRSNDNKYGDRDNKFGKDRFGKDKYNDRDNKYGRDRERGFGDKDRERSSYKDKEKRPKMTRLFVSVGKRDRISHADIVGAFASKTGMRGRDIGEIDIMENFSFVEIPAHLAQEVVDVMHQNTIKGKKASVEISAK